MSINTSDLFDLVQKYNVPGPRYTSYPTAVQFSENVDNGELNRQFKARLQTKKEYSLYIHIPFCFSLCWYCGCTKIITRDQNRADVYLGYLEKEMELLSDTIHPGSEIKQIHFGGGTPTFLKPDQLLQLGRSIQRYFTIHDRVEFSVEIDPRKVGESHIEALASIGCNRASLGVQDTNADVQKAIHRIQPLEQTKRVTEWLRKYTIGSINIDLIYGLPRQTLSTFSQTITDTVGLNPDRFAIYSYAHLPSVMPSQKLLNESEFPSTNEKLSMLIHAIQELPKKGYNYIGMDHFAKETDELSNALHKGSLQRNFQGYSTHAELNMLALGMSGISQGNNMYTQNEKDLSAYYNALDKKQLPIKKVLTLNSDDKLRREVIMEIMCKAAIDFDDFRAHYGITFTDIFSPELEELKPFENDGLLFFTKNGFKITETGRLFLRNIAMVFDRYLKQKQHKVSYSKTV